MGQSLQLVMVNEAATARIAAWLAARAFAGMFLALDGDLGAGKTTFTQYFARALGVGDMVNSPTFTLVREYEDGRLPLFHMDLYRLQASEVFELGFDEYWYDRGVSIVEWSARVDAADLPEQRLAVHIALLDDGSREWVLYAHGAPYVQWLNELQGEWEDLR
jgi:tRNA threonylcarbamoyladenosine biosynthesis protein TsaE